MKKQVQLSNEEILTIENHNLKAEIMKRNLSDIDKTFNDYVQSLLLKNGINNSMRPQLNLQAGVLEYSVPDEQHNDTDYE